MATRSTLLTALALSALTTSSVLAQSTKAEILAAYAAKNAAAAAATAAATTAAQTTTTAAPTTTPAATTAAATTPAATTISAPTTTAATTTAAESTTAAATTTTAAATTAATTTATAATTTADTTTTAATKTAATTACSVMTLGQQGSLGGFVPFLTADAWRTPIAAYPVASNSAAVIATIGASKLHPDFGANDGDTTYGIPYNVVSGTTPVTINYQAYGSESDPGPMPFTAATLVEGATDYHAIVVDRDNCFAYELFNAHVQGDGSWNADSGAVWDLLNNNNRPFGWTSADAAGLPIFPGLTRYDEVTSGTINHALRFTLQHTSNAAVAPATHYAGSSIANAPAMGTRLRLKASYDISGFSANNRAILTALKTYGMILADNGSNMYLSGTSDNRWSNDELHALNTVPASAFEVVSTGNALTTAQAVAASVTSGISTAPVIATFTSSASKVASGSAVTLSWVAGLASYYIVSPSVGAVRGNSVVVKPTKTTTYTLFATNQIGQSTKTVTVTVK